MSDMQGFEHRFAERLRVYAAPAARPPEPAAVAAAIAAGRAVPAGIRRRVAWPARPRGPRLWVLAAALLVLGLIGGSLAGSYLPRPDQGLVVTSTPTPSTPSPMAPATSPTAEAVHVKGWPGNHGSSEPGLYSWDGSTCEPTNCVMGVLHNHGFGPEVRIAIERVSEPTISDASAKSVILAGHHGLYLRINRQFEEWNVDFDGTLISISLSVRAGASEADVDEAHSIIESLVYEQQDTPLGFRLVFTLPSRQWDSPF